MSTINTNRLTGLASGLDTDQIISDMLTAEQTKIDRVAQQQTLAEWKQEECREIITEAQDFYNKYFDPLSSDYILGSNFFSTTTVNSSNSSVITATANASAIAPNYNFEVVNTASGATMKSDVKVSKGDTLADLGLVTSKSFRVSYGDGDSSELITISGDDTIESLISKINKATGSNAKAVYSEMTGTITITSSKLGVNSSLSIENGELDEDGNFVADGTSDALGFLGISGQEENGKNAKVIVTDFDGNLVKEISSEKNTFLIDGVTYNVKAAGKSTITSSTDATDATKKMKEFVEEYNSIMARLHKNLTEKKDSEYPPLTDAQKEEMTEEEIAKWESKAKAGVLRGDSELRSMFDEMKSICDGTLSLFGITSSSDYSKQGQISFDESKFQEALLEDGEKLVNTLTAKLEATKATLKKNVGSSSAVLLKKAGMQNTTSYTTNTLTTEIKKYQEKIKELNKKMAAKEEALYLKFSNLESVMNKFNSQLSMFYSE